MTNIVVGNTGSGLRTDRPAFYIDNDAFPMLSNAFVWRGRALKKRGTKQLGQLTRLLAATPSAALQTYTTVNGTNTFNIFTLLGLNSNEPDASIVLGNTSNISIVFSAPISQTLSDTTGTGILTVTGVGPITSAWINYGTGTVTVTATSAAGPSTAIFILSYYPRLPVMGIRAFNQNFTGSYTPGNIDFPLYVFFDTRYSYLFKGLTGPFYDISYYFGSGAHFNWNGADYQQFWTTNYQGAMWATNNVPGFNFLVPVSITVGNPTQFNMAVDTVQTGDIIFLNEVQGTAGSVLNKGTFVATRTGVNTFTIPVDTTALTVTNVGIVQLLTKSLTGQDGIKYFIGDPIGSPPLPTLTKGWVNFAPPLSNTTNPAYLVGAKIIIPFKNRLLFFATWTQTSTGAPVYNPNQLVACQNGTVFYANGGLPPNQTSDPTSFYQNVVGKGIRLNAPLSQEIICATENNDVIIVHLEKRPLKLYSTGDDSAPFLYQTVSTEFGAESTFSAIPLDSGVLSVGQYGFTMTTQNSAQRIDLQIPDQVFSISQDNNGIERVCAIRDYREEFVYFTFPATGNIPNNADQIEWIYPTTTLAFNYRDNVWSTFIENYTAYGYFQYNTRLTWADLGAAYTDWNGWQDPWNFGSTQSKYPFVAAGNQQGFVLIKQAQATNEEDSQFISNIIISGTGMGTIVTVNSPNHNLNDGDYILISGVLGVDNINGQVFSISVSASLADTFILLLTPDQKLLPPIYNNPPINAYLGGGTYSRLTNFNIITKQFNLAWGDSRQTRLGTQKFLIQKTENGKITINLYVNEANTLIANSSQDSSYLPFTNTLQTSPEVNSLNITQSAQDQIWHRINTSVIGDVVQIEFTLSDAQMRDPDSFNADFVLYGFGLTVYPGPPLAI